MEFEKKTLLIFATREEAAETISALHAKQHDEYTYTYSGGLLLITGMGMQAIYDIVPHYLSGITEIYNYGVAGAINKELPRFSVHSIAQVTSTNRKPIFLQTNGLHLHSVLKPQYTTSGLSADLVDMEGYAICEVANQHQIPCSLIKVVSDYCSSTSKIDIQQALAKASLIIALSIPTEELMKTRK